MKTKIPLDAVYKASDDVVVREIEDVAVIIPCMSVTNDTEKEPYMLNTTGKAVWKKLDGRRNLKNVVAALAAEFKMPAGVIEKDVTGFVRKLLKWKMLVEVLKT
jgi:hypothetical protein